MFSLLTRPRRQMRLNSLFGKSAGAVFTSLPSRTVAVIMHVLKQFGRQHTL